MNSELISMFHPIVGEFPRSCRWMSLLVPSQDLIDIEFLEVIYLTYLIH